MNQINIYGENYKIEKEENINGKLHIHLISLKKECQCPRCKELSKHKHTFYVRKLQDTPIHNMNVVLHVTAWKYKCSNKECNHKIFSEELDFARKNKVMTDMLVQFILSLCIFMSSSTTSLILSLLGVNVSADTIDNILKKVEIKDNLDVEEIGIDDVAIRKGLTYATAIYDMKDHRIIALLDGRKKEDVEEWFKKHPKIKKVTRDRASAYANAISEFLTDCVQVADRFHLFENIIKYLKDYLYNNLPDKIFIENEQVINYKPKTTLYPNKIVDADILNKFNYNNDDLYSEDGTIIKFEKKVRNVQSSKSKKQAQNRIDKSEKYLKIKSQLNKGINKKEIIKEFKTNYRDINKIQNMTIQDIEKLKSINSYREKANKMTPYVNIIYKMLLDNIGHHLIHAYVIKLGYSHSHLYLKNYIILLARNNNLNSEYKFENYTKIEYPKSITIISRKDILLYITTINKKKINKDVEKYFDIIAKKYPLVMEAKEIFLKFHETIFSNNENKLDDFIDSYNDNAIIKTFCKGLKKDKVAIKQAISSNISSGFVEGNNNKFKLIKRIVYGKQKLCNLFKRCYLSFAVKLDDFVIEDIVEGVLKS